MFIQIFSRHRRNLLLLGLLLFLSGGLTATTLSSGTNAFIDSNMTPDLTVLFTRPADVFTQAIPLGNGRLGAMVFGRTDTERIALNEITLWSGGPQDGDRKDAYQYLKPIQNYLLKGENKKAQDLLQKHFTALGKGTGSGNGANDPYGSYQTAGDLLIKWNKKASVITDYRRTLYLGQAKAVVSYIRDGYRVKEEVFSDRLNDITWVRLSTVDPEGLKLSISLDRKENIQSIQVKDSRILMKGQLPDGNKPGMRYINLLNARVDKGQLITRDSSLEVKGASTCVIQLDTRTDYDPSTGICLPEKNLEEKSRFVLAKNATVSFAHALAANTKDYLTLFDRCRLRIPAGKELAALKTMPTERRLIRYYKGNSDPTLPVLYFNFGRYLLISSSRPGLLPANLQGLWAVEYQAPWNADYHLNINLQMNYWLAETTNLSDLADPLFRFTKHLVPNGEKTAWNYYRAKGWVAHVATNPWFFTSPGEGAAWGSTLTGGAWLCDHIWEHFRFTKDTAFLKDYYNVLKGAARFLSSILIREPQHGWLVTAPSNSPENAYRMPGGFEGQTCMGPTMDMQISRDIFSATIQASKILGKDKIWADSLRIIYAQLAPDQISSTDGGVQEWLNDWPSTDPHHRHTSQLFGLYPYDEITPWGTPELAKAARKTLELRGDGGTGWSRAWKISFWARLGDGDHAFKLLKGLLTPVTDLELKMKGGAGTYPNLFDAHPPFQIDGNFGAVAGIAEMLLQSHGKEEVIRFLPALPSGKDWAEGEIKGIAARGGFHVDFCWKGHRVVKATIKAQKTGVCRVLLPEGLHLYNSEGRKLKAVHLSEGVAEFKAVSGLTYNLH
ncbi:glycoside hydrolase family 95 protein [Arachidicoccus terrestris]|uniref:glycoside hydrolase family 95 protein n=1 Tax=Arachidicoccus terrestris TaxID=2875539 RepID=UPI001CC3E910|nr:glycoside hydrolase family 95 protein [Arachidicoccus terrestris]UAY54892.1 glycoside hydrolase N-terminal domain-containing protein [Arachidicoccus terrestris]